MKVSICNGSKCVFYGASHIMDCLFQMQEELHTLYEIPEGQELEIDLIPCNGDCKRNHGITPVVYIEDEKIERAKATEVMEKILYRFAEENGGQA